MIFDFRKQEGETEYTYKWRVYKAKQQGQLDDYSWDAIAEELNKNLREKDNYLGESVYRKEAALLDRWYANMFTGLVSGDSADMQEAIEELKRERVKLRDERTLANQRTRAEARFEKRMDMLEDVMKRMGRTVFLEYEPRQYEGDKSTSMLALVSDLHIGEAFCSYWGQYNTAIASDLLGEYLQRTIAFGRAHKVEDVWVALLGDQISGAIHRSITISNEVNIIEQTKLAAQHIASFIYELSQNFKHIHVISVCGNHSRLDPKELAVKDERMDDLVTFATKCSLQHLPNVSFCEGIDTSLDVEFIHGKSYVFVHGDLDNLSTDSLSKLITKVGFVPYCICLGHNHSPMYREWNGIKIVQGGSFVPAADDYTTEKRITGGSSQTALLLDESGIALPAPFTLGAGAPVLYEQKEEDF